MEVVSWCVACVVSCAMGAGAVAFLLHDKFDALRSANAAWAASNGALKAKLKERKRQLLKALVKLEYGRE
jgi:hypothetical protein